MFFVDGLVDGDVMQRVVASLQGLDKKTVDRAKTAGEFMAYNLAFLDCLLASDMKQGIQFLYSGLIPLLIDGYDQIIIIDGRDYPLRSVAEPSKEKSLRGAKDGFVEAMMMNIALLRRRSGIMLYFQDIYYRRCD